MRSLLHTPRTRKRGLAAATIAALALITSVLVAPAAQALSDTGTGGVFVPVTGARIVDSAMTGKQWKTVQVAGKGGVPSDGSAGAVSVVATLIGISKQGILTGRPNADEPSTTMGIYGGENNQNTSFSAVLAVNSDGTIQVSAETNARLLLDVQGYYTANTDGTAPGGFVPMNGSRIVDTRNGTGAPKAALTSGKTVDLQVGGVAGVPKDASAVIVNMIAANTGSTSGFFTPYATGGTRPPNSFNYAGGGVATSMQAQVKLSSAGKLTVFNQDSTADLVLEVQGYFTAAGKGGAVFTPGAGRAYDTRTGGNKAVGANETRSIQIAGKAGVPVMGSGINAVVLTLTALKSTAGSGNATVWADGTTRPSTTSINFDQTTIRTNTITVPLGANGKVALNNVADWTDYVIDVQGWYSNPMAPRITCPGYAAGSWTATMPTDDIACSITAPAMSESDETIVPSIDGGALDPTPLNDSGETTISVSIPASAGTHTLTAQLKAASWGNAAPTSAYGFGLGDWAKKDLTATPADGSTTPLSPSLAVASSGNDDFLPDAQYRYLVATSPTGFAAPVADSGWVTGPFDLTQGTLSSGTTYYWQAEVKGTSGASSAVADVTSPTWSFATNTTDNVAQAQQICGQMADKAIAAAQNAGVTNDSLDQYVACSETTVQVQSTQPDASNTTPAAATSALSKHSAVIHLAADSSSQAATDTSFAYNIATDKGVDLTGLSEADAADAVSSIQPTTGTDDGAATTSSFRQKAGSAAIKLASTIQRASSTPSTDGLSATYRQINSTYKETIGAQMAYGLKRKGKWVSRSTIKNTVVLNLGGIASASVSYTWTSLSNRQIASTVRPTLFQQHGIASPSYVDGVIIGEGKGIPTFHTSYSDKGTLLFNRGAAKYHIEPLTLEVNDLAYGHKFTYIGSLGVGHRWQCYKTVVCKFPGGKEAGV
ncbi:hypothetical protein HP467_01955 [Curtobacterium albidum]|uniref:Fibronectin type-III domain-containing protein n=1 Tax=Curtobacterium citreum TaxID=2036 RepID=A0A850DQJ5_9MICO|nr:hypothetical protein [Curtobacterium albidum]NUU26879.1 hypothetical protein [Curtobacterium albidum]